MRILLLPLLLIAASLRAGEEEAERTRTYRIRQTTRLDQIPAGARAVRWWISIPEDDCLQEILDFDILSAPAEWSLGRDIERSHRFLFVEIAEPKTSALEVVCEFTLRRRPVHVVIDDAKVGPLSDGQRRIFAEHLRHDAPHLGVTEAIARAADGICGGETNIALQARLLLDHVAESADHYSRDPTKPRHGVGDAAACIANQGGTCTDMHSLFIALARARGIPARLQTGYRLLAKNEGKEVDPGYRCWVEYFVPGYGWIPADIVEADAPDGLGRDRWFTGLTERRLRLNSGREFQLLPETVCGSVDVMSLGYAEVDGAPARLLPEGDLKPQLTRWVHFVEVDEGRSAAIHTAPE